MPGLLTQRRGRARAREVGAELLRLHDGSLDEGAAGDPRWKPEGVLDARGGRWLARDGDDWDDQGGQPVGGAVDSRRETGWPRTDHDEVETALGKAGDGQAEVLC